MRRLLSVDKSSFEYSVWRLFFKSITIHCIGIYIPQSLATPNKFVTKFLQFLEDIVPKYSNIMIMGDFNLHVHENSSDTTEFNNSLSVFSFVQHVDFPTHLQGCSLDLVITKLTNGVNLFKVPYC